MILSNSLHHWTFLAQTAKHGEMLIATWRAQAILLP